MTDIIATLKPAQGIQCELSLLYLFDPNVVISITETTTREWLDAESQNYINTYIKPLLDDYEQDKERQIDAYVEEKQSTIFFDNTNFTGTTTAEILNVTNSASFNDVTLTGSINTSTAIFTDVIKMRASVSFKGAVAPSWRGIGIYELNDDDSVSLMASMEKIDGFTPANNNTYNIGVNSRKWKDLYLAGKAYIPTINNGGDIAIPTSAGTMALTSDLTNFADKDLSNLTSTGKNIANWSSNVSNCITEIPQDIKLELDNGAITLKAGSKLYTPNGVDVFDTYTTTSDIILPAQLYNDDKIPLAYTEGLGIFSAVSHSSGTISARPTASTSYTMYYATDENKCYFDTGSWIQCSLPIAIVSRNNSVGYYKIDQIFNGFGYIGSTIFTLPNIKGLIPDGRNDDGTLKSIEITTDSVKVRTFGITDNEAIIDILSDLSIGYLGAIYYLYDEQENFVKQTSPQIQKRYSFVIAKCSMASGVITSFIPKTSFRSVDYSDTEFIGHQAMPSDKYIDITLPANNSIITALANGYYTWSKVTNGNNQMFGMVNQTTGLCISNQVALNGAWTEGFFPVKKGDSVLVKYTAGGTLNYFRFVYAEGEV